MALTGDEIWQLGRQTTSRSRPNAYVKCRVHHQSDTCSHPYLTDQKPSPQTCGQALFQLHHTNCGNEQAYCRYWRQCLLATSISTEMKLCSELVSKAERAGFVIHSVVAVQEYGIGFAVGGKPKREGRRERKSSEPFPVLLLLLPLRFLTQISTVRRRRHRLQRVYNYAFHRNNRAGRNGLVRDCREAGILRKYCALEEYKQNKVRI